MTNNAPMPICLFCNKERENLDGWHSCPAAQDQKAFIEKQIDDYSRIAESQAEGYVSPEDAQKNYLDNVEPYDNGR